MRSPLTMTFSVSGPNALVDIFEAAVSDMFGVRGNEQVKGYQSQGFSHAPMGEDALEFSINVGVNSEADGREFMRILAGKIAAKASLVF